MWVLEGSCITKRGLKTNHVNIYKLKMKIKLMILNYLINIVASLKSIHVGTLLIKIKASIKLSLLISPFAFLAEWFSKLDIDNQNYIIIVLFAIGIDHLLGTYKHLFIDKDFTWKKNIVGVAVKVGLVVAIPYNESRKYPLAIPLPTWLRRLSCEWLWPWSS